MADLAERLQGWLMPAILVAFLILYILGIRSGLQPEMALLQSGGAGAALAVLGRLAVGVVSVERQSSSPIDVTASPVPVESVSDASKHASETSAVEQGEQQQQAVGV